MADFFSIATYICVNRLRISPTHGADTRLMQEVSVVFDPTKIQLTATDKGVIHWYDGRCKRVLSNKMVLAHLLKATMREFSGIDPEIIARRYIEGKPGVVSSTNKIQGLRNERDAANRNASFFDIIFYVLLPDSECSIPIFINVEPQTKYDPGYDLCNRGVFYAACMLADQKDSVFDKSNYDDLRKVCSIWVCMEPSKTLANTIVSYSLEQHSILGHCPNHPIDKMQIVLVHVGTEDDDNYTGLMQILDKCLSKKSNTSQQKDISDRYHLKLEQEDFDMTAGEQLVWQLKKESWEAGEEIGRKAGEEIGRKAGEEIGRKAGEKTGLENGKKFVAQNLKSQNISYEVIHKSTGLSYEEIEKL